MEYVGFTPDKVEVPEDQLERRRKNDAEYKPLCTPEAVKVLELLRDKMVREGIANPHDTHPQVCLKQGKLNMVLDLLEIAERLNNGDR